MCYPDKVIGLWLVIAIVWSHYFADFVCQTDEMAKNKSKSNWWLTAHILVYSALLVPLGLKYAIVNGAIHWCVDWVTSRINAKSWADGKVHRFFNGVGADQAIHYTTLFLTAYVML